MDGRRGLGSHPARHEASDSTSSSLPPTGMRVRLRASFRSNDDVLHELDDVTGRDLEVVDTTGLISTP